MVNFKFFSLAFFAANALFANAQEDPAASAAAAPVEEEAAAQHQLNITARTVFPNSELGVRLVNGELTNAAVHITNYESEAINVNIIAGELFDVKTGESVRNLTMAKYQTQIPAGQEQLISYPIELDMHPADLALSLTAFVLTAEKVIYTLPVFQDVVSIVEPPTSIFDPQILFLYFFLGSLFAATFYFFYTVWVAPYLPAKQRKAAASKTTSVKAVEKTEPATASGSDIGGASYNTEWIPAHHIARPEARKVKGNAKKARS
ncbi:hypothetical protein AAP_00114 [Ascosphaera apis ARSEF 7405]|uniref:Translocon-associated protein subunit alpha n=1 Tax=Ascosphaera apis ARSEF 7405 TaxID=392613 RepID=A0A168DKT5_9EURO|nr:hypothetical protein AAP_00114 [Ascosphaera apis ARSEF 7405]